MPKTTPELELASPLGVMAFIVLCSIVGGLVVGWGLHVALVDFELWLRGLG